MPIAHDTDTRSNWLEMCYHGYTHENVLPRYHGAAMFEGWGGLQGGL